MKERIDLSKLSLILILILSLSICSTAIAVPNLINGASIPARTLQEPEDIIGEANPGLTEKGSSATAKARAIVAELIRPEMDDFQKAVALHDWIVDNTRYNYKAKGRYTADGPLLYGSAVCDGYAKAYQLLCREAKVTCKYVVGRATNSSGTGGHAWNMVRIDGNWYHVDCTWDDPSHDVYGGDPAKSGSEYHGYFGLTDAAIRWDHSRWSPATKCTAITYNYFYRMGLLDDRIRIGTQSIQQKLDTGTTTFEVAMPDGEPVIYFRSYRELLTYRYNIVHSTIVAMLSARTWTSRGVPLELKVEYKDSSYSVSPKPVPITSLAFKEPPAVMTIGATQQLAFIALPSHATNTSVTWSSSNSRVLSVDKAGLVTANRAGSAKITIKATDGSRKSASVLIKVAKP